MPAPHQPLVRKAFGVVETEALGDRQIRVRVSTDQVDRSGDVVVQKGIDFRNFMLSKTVLWNHDQDHPVASCQELGLANGQLVGIAQFPPIGVSAKADEVYGLAKAGVINAASIGFLPGEIEPVDGKNARNGLRIVTCELMEFSFVSVPANSGAEVLQRAFNPDQARDAHGEWTVSSTDSKGNSEVTAHDSEDDASKEAARRSSNGHTNVTYGGAKSGDGKGQWTVTSTDPDGNKEITTHASEDDAMKEAALRASNGHTHVTYGTGGTKVLRATETKAPLKLTIKGLYAVSELAWLLQMLGYQVDASVAERAREGDASTVPDQLTDVLHQLGDALVAMTSEEVAELIAGNDDPGLDDCPVLMHMLGGLQTKSGAARAKAGRKISAATDDAMRGHLAKVAQGVAAVQSGHAEMVKMLDAAQDDDDASEDGDDPDEKAAAAQARRVRELETLRLA